MLSVSAVPFELWTDVFKRVDTPDLKICSLVCKSWRRAALPLLGYSISIKLSNNQINQLAKDLGDYPSIGRRISRITIVDGPPSTTPTRFMDVVNACSGQMELRFDVADVYCYLAMLYYTKLVVPDIQEVYVSGFFRSNLVVNPSETIQLYLKVNFRFHTTISSICVPVNGDSSDILEGYGGLVEYVANFPMLQSLTALSDYANTQSRKIELSRLLDQNSRLKYLELDCFYSIGVSEFVGEHEQLPLTSFKMSSVSTNFNLLRYIMSRFKNLQNIRVRVDVLLPCPSLTEPESTHYLEEFLEYGTTIKSHDISCGYEDMEFLAGNTVKFEVIKTRPINPNLYQRLMDIRNNNLNNNANE